jgi:hypothetical protein
MRKWLVLFAFCGATAASGQPVAEVPAPFEALLVRAAVGAVEVSPWGRSYRFAAGPLPVAVRSQGVDVLAAAPRFRVGTQPVVWEAPEVVEASPARVRLRSRGAVGSLSFDAETRIEYDGMIEVDLTVRPGPSKRLPALAYEISLARESSRYFAHHLPYDYQVANVDKGRLIEAAGHLPERLILDFVPTLAVGGHRVGVEWWSETNAHWRQAAGRRPFELQRVGNTTELRVQPVVAPIELEDVWRDRFTLFVFPSRPAPDRWRSVRILPYNRAANFKDAGDDIEFVWLAMQKGFHAKYDGLPGSVDDAFQRGQRKRLAELGVSYMPYGMLTLAPILHPRTMTEFPRWSAEGRWWKLQPGHTNAVVRRTHPELQPGAPYTYPACAAESDYFDWMLEENVQTLRKERPDALYFDHGGITRMCVRSPRLAGKPAGTESWEYGNVRRFYKRLYEAVQRVRPDARIVIHSHGAPKALGAFVDFHMFGEALNVEFAGGVPTAQYRADPSLYRPDYLDLPDGFLEAHFYPRVGGVPSLLPQVLWAMDPARPERARAYQRMVQAIVLVNDVHAPLWVSDLDAAEAVIQAIDRFGDLGNATVHPWWANADSVRVPKGLRSTAWVREGRALLVLANFGAEEISGRVLVDRARLSLPALEQVSDLERPGDRPRPISDDGFEVSIPPRELRLLRLE